MFGFINSLHLYKRQVIMVLAAYLNAGSNYFLHLYMQEVIISRVFIRGKKI